MASRFAPQDLDARGHAITFLLEHGEHLGRGVGEVDDPGLSRQGRISLMIRVRSPASSRPLICTTNHSGVWLTTSDEIAEHYARTAAGRPA
jgi:hypothetical protein